MSHKFKVIFIIMCLILASLALVPYKYKWLLMYGEEAEVISENMLNKKQLKLPDWALDFTISGNNKSVIFSNHDHKNLFAYSGNPITDNEIAWEHVWGNWYHYEH